MTTLVIKYLPINKIQNKVSRITLPQIGWKLFAVLVFFIFCLSVYYVFQVNSITRENYLLKDYQKILAIFMAERGDLEANFARVGFLDNIQQKIQFSEFEKTSAIKYIQISEDLLVRAK